MEEGSEDQSGEEEGPDGEGLPSDGIACGTCCGGGLDVDNSPAAEEGYSANQARRYFGGGLVGLLFRYREMMSLQKLGGRQAREAEDLEGILAAALLAGGVAVGRITCAVQPIEGGGDALAGALARSGRIGGSFLTGGGRCLFVVFRRCLPVGLVDALVAPVDVLQILVQIELLVGRVVVAGGDAPTASGEAHHWRRSRSRTSVLPALGRRLIVAAVAVAQAGRSAVGFGEAGGSSCSRPGAIRNSVVGGSQTYCRRGPDGRGPLAERLDARRRGGGEDARRGYQRGIPPGLSSHGCATRGAVRVNTGGGHLGLSGLCEF